MQLLRTALAFAIAVSLALLPVGASAASVAMSAADTQHSMHMAPAGDMSMDDCCPDMNDGPSHSDDYKCGMGLCCIGGIVALTEIRVLQFDLLPPSATKIGLLVDQVVSTRPSNPPFRPPRA
jgi:hypothetical protein